MHTTMRKNVSWIAMLAGLLVGIGALPVSAAEMMKSTGAYWTGPGGEVWRNGWGECWRSIHWSEQTAIKECDPQLFKEEPMEKEMKPAKMKEPQKQMERVTLQAETLFDFDKSVLKPEARSVLDNLANRIREYQNVGAIRITGHADRIGSDAYNDKLSMRRAQAVADYLRDKPMLGGHSFDVRAMGERVPVVSCDGMRGAQLIECLAPNRRVEIEVAASREAMQ